jgi:hypothetical protein
MLNCIMSWQFSYIEAKLAYDYFCKKINNPVIINLMATANHQATDQLMAFD